MVKDDFETVADGLDVSPKIGDIKGMAFETKEIEVLTKGTQVAEGSVFF